MISLGTVAYATPAWFCETLSRSLLQHDRARRQLPRAKMHCAPQTRNKAELVLVHRYAASSSNYIEQYEVITNCAYTAEGL